MNKFVIIGGGTAGWLTALTVKRYVPYCDVTVIASSEIGILGAGEGVTPHFNELMSDLDIPMTDIYANAKATSKKGIKFTNWNGDGTSYFHPFWEEKDAVHFDASKLAQFLQSTAISRGVKHIDDIVTGINSKPNGDIESFNLQNHETVQANFVFDCSGLHRLIIGKHFNAEWVEYSDSLPCNRALPFFIQHDDLELPEYTEAIAMKYGWVWKIPVQGRYGCGYVFDKRYISDDQAKQEVRELFGDVEFPRVFDFKAGAYKTPWVNNCIAIGLSSGFTEPLEATSIWIQILSLRHYLLQEPYFVRGNRHVVDSYNEFVGNINTYMKDFIHAHYLSNRKDSKFWQEFKWKQTTPHYVTIMKHFKGDLEDIYINYVNKVNGMKYDSPVVPASWNVILRGTNG